MSASREVEGGRRFTVDESDEGREQSQGLGEHWRRRGGFRSKRPGELREGSGDGSSIVPCLYTDFVPTFRFESVLSIWPIKKIHPQKIVEAHGYPIRPHVQIAAST